MKLDFLKKKTKWINRLFPTSMFPLEVKDFWLCGHWYNKPRKTQMKYFNGNYYVEWKVGDVTPLYKNKGYKAIYKITKVERTGYDNAEYDDGKKYWMRLVKVVKDKRFKL